MSTGSSKWSDAWTVRYALAVAAVVIAAVIALPLSRLHAPSSVIVFIYLIAIMVSAWRGGYGPGVLATVVSDVIGPYLVDPHLTLARLDLVRLALILLISLLISKIADSRRKAETSLRNLNSQLDKRVLERTVELRRANEALRESEARLLQQAEQLQRSNTDLEHFAYVASHDMQEPLRMVGIYAELFQRRYRDTLDSDGKRYLEFIVAGAVRAQRLVVDLLAYSRSEIQHRGAHPPADLNRALQVAIINVGQLVHDAGARITASPLPTIPCDPSLMTQIFQNLLSNAIKYRSASPPEIEVRADKADSEWVFAVQDNGVGIRPEYHQMIFAPFKRLHGPEIPGSGIGLAICTRIVERQGGRIWVESEQGKGATFKFSVPISHDERGLDEVTGPGAALKQNS